MVSTVPIYLSEISSPKHRGLIGGISGCGISFGTMMSNWVGFSCSYAPYGPTQWRLPLGIQVPWGVIMFIGLATFMPNSPRQLIRAGKFEQARTEFIKIRRDLQSHEVHEEFALMRAQIEFEMEREIKSYKEIFRLFRHRALVSIAVQTMTSLTGVNVIQVSLEIVRVNMERLLICLVCSTTKVGIICRNAPDFLPLTSEIAILYKSLGIESKTILALAGVYGTMAFVSNAITTKFLTDQWGRRKSVKNP